MNKGLQKYLKEVEKLSEEYVKIADVLKLIEPVQLAKDLAYNVRDIHGINGLVSKNVALYVYGQIRYKLIGK